MSAQAMNSPVFVGEYRGYNQEEIKYTSQKTGNQETFVKRVVRLEASNGTPIAVSLSKASADFKPESFKKGSLIQVEIIAWINNKGNIEASADVATMKVVA